ncbi:polyisoprenoid-binding protein, partial [Escherichia coli O25b:H4-ST131]|nr:polyisoprenoid-binding protein [Escherichia coli O25b:H4-ST131]
MKLRTLVAALSAIAATAAFAAPATYQLDPSHT